MFPNFGSIFVLAQKSSKFRLLPKRPKISKSRYLLFLAPNLVVSRFPFGITFATKIRFCKTYNAKCWFLPLESSLFRIKVLSKTEFVSGLAHKTFSSSFQHDFKNTIWGPPSQSSSAQNAIQKRPSVTKIAKNKYCTSREPFLKPTLFPNRPQSVLKRILLDF